MPEVAMQYVVVVHGEATWNCFGPFSYPVGFALMEALGPVLSDECGCVVHLEELLPVTALAKLTQNTLRDIIELARAETSDHP